MDGEREKRRRRCIDNEEVPCVLAALALAAEAWRRESEQARLAAGEHRDGRLNPMLEPGEEGARVMDVLAVHYDGQADLATRIAGKLSAA